jgi:hypothetical protein
VPAGLPALPGTPWRDSCATGCSGLNDKGVEVRCLRGVQVGRESGAVLTVHGVVKQAVAGQGT